ncbi:six-cysteine ranthipeptide SCIFF [Streptomyces sp. ISL-96]|nr:six-cysteine ranthipeptide SCIFF [Streptomyces sp. ISL-96]
MGFTMQWLSLYKGIARKTALLQISRKAGITACQTSCQASCRTR